MKKGLFADSPPVTQFIMLCFTMMACFLLFLVIGMLLAPPILGIRIDEMMEIINSGDMTRNLNLLRYMQTLQSISLFIIPSFFAAYLFSGNAINYLGVRLNNSKLIIWFGLAFLLALSAIPFINLLAALNEMISFPESLSALEQKLRGLEENAQHTTKLFLNVNTTSGMFFNIFMMAILPALGEELIFRGLLQKIFFRWTGNIHIAIVVTGFLFSIMHLQFYGLFPRWLLGVLFGYMLVWSGTIWLPVFAHFVNNATAVIVYRFINSGIINEKIETFGANWTDIPVTVLSTALCGGLVLAMYRKWSANNKPISQ